MTGLRKVTGKEGTNFWQERYGQKAGKSAMISRVGRYTSFASTATQTIEKTGSYTSNNILIHSIRVFNTSTGDDIRMRLYSGTSGTTTLLDAKINRTWKQNNTVNFDFPIPILSVGGGRINCDAGGLVIAICYTILESTTTLPDQENIFLQAVTKSFTELSDDPVTDTEVSVVSDADCEIVGVYANHTGFDTSPTEWAEIVIKNNISSPVTIAQIGSRANTPVLSSGHDNYEAEPTTMPWWLPYPIYARKGFRLVHVGAADGEEDMNTVVFYRKVKAFDVDHGWI